MSSNWNRIALTAAAVSLACVASVSARADAVADFYKNKTVTLIVSYGAGGSYGLYGRLLANHAGKYLPGNPKIIVQYMPGAGGVKATNYLYNAAPRDGTFVGTVFKDLAVMQALRPEDAKFDASKFNWIGSATEYKPVIAVLASSGIKSLDDAKRRGVVIAVSGRNHHGFLMSSIMNHLVGTKFKMVTGYRGARAMNLAMEQGEADAGSARFPASSGNSASASRTARSWSSPNRVRKKRPN